MKTNDNNNDQTWGRTKNESYIWENEGRQENHHRGKGPKGYKRSDSRIEEDIHDRLTFDNFLDASNIEVAVMEGEVTLSGTVSEKNDKRRAEDLTEAVRGVLNVENQIKVKRNSNSNNGSEDNTPSSEHHYKGLIHSQSTSPKSIF